MPEGAVYDDGASIADAPFLPHVTSSTTPFTGHVWDVRTDAFEYNGETITRDYVDHTGAVGVLVLDDDDRVLLIRQYRHPVGRREWEIPAGLLDVDGESPITAARRELAEEVDLAADRWDLLAEYATSPGGSTEAIRIFLARDVAPTDSGFTREGEEADMELRWVALDDAVDAILRRDVQNSLTVIAVLTAAASRARGWATLAAADTPWPERPRRGASRA